MVIIIKRGGSCKKKDLIKLLYSSGERKDHSRIAASRIAVAAWNLAFGNVEFSVKTDISFHKKSSISE